MSPLQAKCSLCLELADSEPSGRWWTTQCSVCGPYRIAAEAAEELVRTTAGQRAEVSAWVRELEIKNAPVPFIVSSEYERKPDESGSFRLSEILGLYAPKTVGERLDRVLLNLGRMSKAPGEKVALENKHRVACFAETPKQALFFLGALHRKGLISDAARIPTEIMVTVDGWNRIAELGHATRESRQVFVAMSFDPSMESAWRDGLAVGVEDVGLMPLRVDKKEHNEKICDVITNEIRRSCLVVADVTLQRQGVYFEAGFAMGLQVPVIWTCRKDDMGNCHFDTRQYNHINWSSPEELRERLRRRIEATIPHLFNRH